MPYLSGIFSNCITINYRWDLVSGELEWNRSNQQLFVRRAMGGLGLIINLRLRHELKVGTFSAVANIFKRVPKKAREN